MDNRAPEAGNRLELLGALFDPGTFRRMEALGISPGWRCWEVGAGGPTVVRWLAERTSFDGRVLATDIDVSWAASAAAPTVEVRRHDVTTDGVPEGGFDLVHARLVLVHLPDRAAALKTMVAALRPGGWLLLEDADPALQPLSCIDPQTPAEALANRIRTGFRTLLAKRGADLAFGRTLPRLMRAAGLSGVEAEGWFPLAHPACAPLEAATLAMIRGQLLEHGIVTAAEIDEHLVNVAAGRLDLAQPPLISAWGRKL